MIPITLFTGFLGAGKTTIIKELLQVHPKTRFGFVINEFGEVGIDGSLITSTKEDIVELSNGCLCCVVRADLLDAIRKLALTEKVDHIIIEASGLAELTPMIATFASIPEDYPAKLDSVVGVLDVENFSVQEDTYELAIEQLQHSDVIVCNKIKDPQSERLTKLKLVIQKLNPDGGIIVYQEKNDLLGLIDNSSWTTDRLKEASQHQHVHDHGHEKHHHHHDDFNEQVFKTDKVFDPVKLDQWIQNQMPESVIRAKGILQLKSKEGVSWFEFQMVGAQRTLKALEGQYSDSVLVCIGKNVTDISKSLSSTLL